MERPERDRDSQSHRELTAAPRTPLSLFSGWRCPDDGGAAKDLSLRNAISSLVPSKGLEPPHRCRYMDLNHARLPIPPRWQFWTAMQRRPQGRRVRKINVSILQPCQRLSNHTFQAMSKRIDPKFASVKLCVKGLPEPEASPQLRRHRNLRIQYL